MTTNEFEKFCRKEISDYIVKEHKIEPEVINTVWQSKSLQNMKGTFFCEQLPGWYFEMTLNGDKDEIYLDVYKKKLNKCIKI